MLSLFVIFFVLEIAASVLIFKYSKSVAIRRSRYAYQALISNAIIMLLMIGHLLVEHHLT